MNYLIGRDVEVNMKMSSEKRENLPVNRKKEGKKELAFLR
jgi:hypothetical protein